MKFTLYKLDNNSWNLDWWFFQEYSSTNFNNSSITIENTAGYHLNRMTYDDFMILEVTYS
jgi:hypothetical protein